MISARGKLGTGQPVVFLGVTWEELRKLRAGQHLKLDLETLGLDGHVFVFAGASEEVMAEDLKKMARDDGVEPRPVAETDKDSFFPKPAED